MRQIGDKPADSFVALLMEDNPQAALPALHRWAEERHTPVPLLLYPEHPFWLHYVQLPEWANPQLLKEGRAFFGRHAQDIMLLLGFLSLPYCYAAADGAKVLYRSRRILEDTRRRLAETARFVLAVHAEDAFDLQQTALPQPLRLIIAVRLMHAAVRYHIRRSGKWESRLWGVPVNQEDMAGTNLAFSFIIIQGLRKIGCAVSHEQAAAFLHLWNVVGHFLGLEEQLLPADEKTAARLERIIARRQFKSSAESIALTQALIDSIESNVNLSPLMRLKGFVPSYMRFLLGNQVADLLGIPPATLPDSFFGLYKIRNLLREGRNEHSEAADFQGILQRIYGRLTYRIPEKPF